MRIFIFYYTKGMFEIFKKKKVSTPLFVISSVVALLILFGAYSIFKVNLAYQQNKNVFQDDIAVDDSVNDETDPLIMRAPDARPLIDQPTVSLLDPSMGDERAQVVIVEFSDFECSFCQKQEQVLKRVLQKHKDRVKLVWKDYPNRDFGSPSFRAAVAARCADEQGKFWPFHDFLFEQNKNLTEDNFLNIAKLLELNEGDFKTCLKDDDVRGVVEESINEANDLNITGVPFFYVNKQEIMGEISEEKLEKIIQVELARE